MSVTNKNVIITGAAGGIGRAAALAFAKDGFGVLINYRTSEDAALALCREINEENGRAVCFRADVSARSEVDEMTDFARRELGRIGVLINNAGIAQQKMFCDITEQDFDRMMGVTVKGAFNCIQAALPDMVHEKSGKIINVSSMWGVCGASCEVHYSAAKAGLIGLTKSAAKELAGRNVTVNAVAPGFVETDMTASLPDDVRAAYIDAIPLKRLGTPQDIADAVAFLASPGAGYITGQVIRVDGGMSL